MSDGEEEENTFDVEDYHKLKKEVDVWKAKCKSLELKKREAELALNKIKTEINSLRSVDKLWKDSAKTVVINLRDVKNAFDVQVDQVLDGLSNVSKGGERVTQKAGHMRSIKKVIGQLQATIATQGENIVNLNTKIRVLTAELKEKTEKCERLSAGIEEEVERLIKPMREKLSETVVALMKEKAARAQERRELADLWPVDYLMPTLLMRYRTLSPEENERRVKYAIEQNASMALSLEVRANVIESKMWEIKYDDYGRPFYQHMKTGEKSEEAPEIMSYKPPPGRDEDGNVILNEQNDIHHWHVLTDTRGQVYFKHKITGTVTYYPPYAYKKLPPGKTREQIVAEAASLVLDFVKEKIAKHIAIKKKRKEELENPLTPEERKKKEKQEKNRTAEEIAAAGPELTEEGEPIDLSQYQYDIETVEMLAYELTSDVNNADKDMEEVRKERRSFLEGKEVRKFQEELYEGKTLLETDLNILTTDDLRGIVEELAIAEEKYEAKLSRTRTNLKDFSFVLSERIASQKEDKINELRELKTQQEKDLKTHQKTILAEKKAKLKEKQDLLEKEKALKAAEIGSHGEVESKLTEDEKHKEQHQDIQSMDSISELGDDIVDKGGDNESKAGAGEENASLVTPRTKKSEVEGSATKSVLSGSGTKLIPGSGAKSVGSHSIVLPLEEEEREIDELEKTIEQPLKQYTDEELSKEIYGDKVFLLFGEISVDPKEYDCSEELLRLCNNLCNFTLFSGFMNINMTEYPYGANANYSLLEEDLLRQKNQAPIIQDDNWLTCHFFLGCTKEQLSQRTELLRKEYTSSTGLLPIGPLDTEKILFYSRTSAEVSRSMDHGYTSTTRSIEESIIANQHCLWKNEQLMNEIIKYQIQQNAIKSLLTNRMNAYEDSKNNLSFQTSTPVVKFSFSNMKLQLQQRPTSVKNNLYYVQFTLGSFSKKSKPIVLTPSQFLEWYNEVISGELSINSMQLDELIVEIIDENPDTLEKFIVGKGFTPVHEICGGNLGRDISFQIELKKVSRKRGSIIEISPKKEENEHEASNEMKGEAPEHGTVASAETQQQEEPDEEEGKDNVADFMKKRRKTVIDPTKLGSITFDLKGILEFKTVVVMPTDPEQLENYNDISPAINEKDPRFQEKRKVPVPNVINIHTPFGQYGIKEPPNTNQIDENAKNFRLLVSELRGDVWNLTKKLTGDYPIKMVFKQGLPEGSSSSSPESNQETKKSSSEPAATEQILPVKNLPNFSNAESYLKKKYSIHEHHIQKIHTEIKEKIHILNDLLKSKGDSMNRTLNEMRMKVKRQLDSTEDVKKDVQKYTKVAFDLRKPNPEPKEPVFQELPPVPYVPQLPPSGGLDARGKKKKALPPNDLKQIIEEIEMGKKDGEEIWNLPDNFFPSQAQGIKITKAIEARNIILDGKRQNELTARQKILEQHAQDHDKWELLEKRRLNELEKAKKDCRKVNIKYDCAMEKLNRLQEEQKHYETDSKNILDLKLLNEKSISLFKLISLKQLFEKERQINFIQSIKKRLLRAINARKFALEYPKTAKDQFSYEENIRKSEESLRFIKYEIYECKHLLIQEGIRLRKFLHEEETYLNNELSRIQLSIEIITQRDLFDQIISKYKTEILQYYNELEKYKLQEADLDDHGKDTVDDQGERYNPTHAWTSSNVIKLQRMLELYLTKVKLTENYGRSANAGQTYLIEILLKQYSENYFCLKDSWHELSDYERSQQLLSDTIQYLTTIRQFIQQQSATNAQPIQEISLMNQLITSRMEDSLILHEKETLNVKNSSIIILNSVKKYLEDYRNESEKKIAHLEASIIDLSRECQKIREELLNQQMIADDKMKVLWAFIHTLQNALQQIAARMEIILEEREKIVIESRLMADNTRHQLRQERKHCANLLFIIHSQKGFIFYLKQIIHKLQTEQAKKEQQQMMQKNELKRDVWETIFTFTRLSTDVDLLFEFFTSRLANLSGSRDTLNNALARNNAAMVIAALCKNPRPIIRRNAARALGNLGWNSFIETRILLWDCMMYWKALKKKILTKEKKEFDLSLQKFTETGKLDSILLSSNHEIEEFVPSGNLSLRSIIKQRRQWALRAARRIEGPNYENQKLLNIKDGVLISLLNMCLEDGAVDSEISRNAALAISIASYEISNHYDMIHNDLCRQMIIQMCQSNDPEVQTHAAITIANLSYKDEHAQMTFGQNGVIPVLIEMLTSTVADVLEGATAALANLTCYCDFNCLQVIEHQGIQKLISIIVYSYSENLLDLDQNDEVHANAAETLANISRFNTKESIKYFLANAIQANNNNRQVAAAAPTPNNPHVPQMAPSASVIDALVIMCASSNKQLKRHVALVIGNIAQNEKIREEIGVKGGIESLFLTVEDSDVIVQSNALWALANLMWYPPNQERAGRFMKEIVNFIFYDFTRNAGQSADHQQLLLTDQEDTNGGGESGGDMERKENHTESRRASFLGGIGEEESVLTDPSNLLNNNSTSQNNSQRPSLVSGGPKNRRQSFKQGASSRLLLPSDREKEKEAREKSPEYRETQMRRIIAKNHHPEQVVINATLLLGNVLYYNTNNRVRFLEIEYSFEILLFYIANRTLLHVKIIESCLRSLLSLSYLDSIALYFGTEEFMNSSNIEEIINKHLELNKKKNPKKYIPLLISYLHAPYYSRDSMRYALEIIGNLCLHHLNRQIIFDYDGIDAIVALHTDPDEKVRNLSMKIIDYLEDITPKEILAKRKALIGLERMVQMSTNPDPLVRTIAAEAIGEEIWNAHQNNHLSLQDTSDPFYNVQKAPTMTIQEKQKIAHEIGAIDSLLANVQLCNQHFDQFVKQSAAGASFDDTMVPYNSNNEGNDDSSVVTHEMIQQDIQLLLPALWSLRNTVHQYYPGQMQFYFCNGVPILAQLIRNVNTGFYQKETEKLLESAISCLISAVSNNHEKNSRKLVMVGLDGILDLTKESTILKNYQKGNYHNTASLPYIQFVIKAIQSEGLQALVNALLLALGPYNYVICKNCHRKQDLHGTSCFYCGHRLLVDVEGMPPLLAASVNEKLINSNNLRTSQSAKDLPAWRHAGKAMQLTPLVTSTSLTAEALNPLTSPGPNGNNNNNNNGKGGKSYFSRTLPAKFDGERPKT